MINREIDFITRATREERVIESYRQEVYTGLESGGLGFLQIPKEVGNQMVLDIARITIDVCKQLKIPLPQVGLIHGWDEPLPGFDKDQSIREVLARAYLDNKDFQAGLISYSPFYIKSELNFRMGINQEPPAPLEYIVAHEAFHIWQYHNNYEQVLKDLGTSDGGRDLQAWFKTSTEQNAIEQGNSWLQNHKVKTRK